MSTSDRNEFDNDDELRALLRGGDPAGSLAPADPAALASLVEDIMSADLDIRPDTDEPASTGRRRTGVTWLVAAAAAAVIAGAGGFAVAQLAGDDSPPPSAGPETTGTGDGNVTAGAHTPVAGETTELTAGAEPARCAAPTPAILAKYPQAFQGEVTAIEDGSVTMTATEVYAGDVGETVVVEAPPALIGALVSTVQFEVGGTYNVAVFDGQVSMCGYSGPAGSTADLFQKAFLR